MLRAIRDIVPCDETQHQPSIRPSDIAHREACRKGKTVLITTSLLTLPRSNQARCFFRSICPLGMSRQARQPPMGERLKKGKDKGHLRRTPVQV